MVRPGENPLAGRAPRTPISDVNPLTLAGEAERRPEIDDEGVLAGEPVPLRPDRHPDAQLPARFRD